MPGCPHREEEKARLLRGAGLHEEHHRAAKHRGAAQQDGDEALAGFRFAHPQADNLSSQPGGEGRGACYSWDYVGAGVPAEKEG